MRATDPLVTLLLGHHGYFFLRSSMLRAFLLGLSSSGPRSAYVSIIWPTRSPTPSMAASIQVKGVMASWKRVPQKAVITQMPHPLHLAIIIAQIRTVTTSLKIPQTSSMRETKNTIGPTTLYSGKKLSPTISIMDP